MNAIVANEVKALLEKAAPEFKAALPAHIPPERFRRVAQTALLQSPDLMRADRASLMRALVHAAQDGLLPDGRQGAVVMYGGKAQWLPMVQGIMAKARNSGEVVSIEAHVAYENDVFRIVLGDEAKIMHEPTLGDPGKPIAVYAIATLKHGERVRQWMRVSEVEKVRRVSKARGGPWDQWWDQMALKSVIKRLAKYLPTSTDRDEDLHRTINREDDEHTIDASAEPEVAVQPPTDRMAALEAAVVAADGSPPDDGWPGPDVPAAPAAPVPQNVSQEELKALAQDPAPVRRPGQ
jgi:recombination protein RecT